MVRWSTIEGRWEHHGRVLERRSGAQVRATGAPFRRAGGCWCALVRPFGAHWCTFGAPLVRLLVHTGAPLVRHWCAFASSISANVNNIPVLNGTNFKKWKEHVIIVLGCMDLDFALREDRPLDLTSTSTAEQRSTMEKWERSNRMSLMIMKHSIPEAIRGGNT
ncbi:hypothetical protein CK203_089087 [Vitis vinifera]|uniref:Uncharacterized protein n=1 Tax=Vitis vinifera TaxID=29760 RepID=A0A438DEC6_VITVI|nr:hypothetical protein CK203_089087 [Vitis vinifera]